MAAMDLHRFTLMWLLVFCQLFLCIECLKAFRGDIEVTKQVVMDSGDECLRSFNESDLPDAVRGKSVDKPGDLHLHVYDNVVEAGGKAFLMSAIRLNWTSPRSEISKEYLKGFYVLIKGETYRDRCRLFVVDHAGFPYDNLEFRLPFEHFAKRKDDFEITVYSLPPPRTMDEIETYERVVVSTKAAQAIEYPGLWVPTIVANPSWDWDQRKGSVDVKFSLPPESKGWHLKEFTVSLIKCGHSLNNEYRQESIIKVPSSRNTEAHLVFEGLSHDLYSVVVGANNSGFDDKNSCVCKRREGPCTNPSCDSAQTAWFDLWGNKYPQPYSLPVDKDSCAPPMGTDMMAQMTGIPLLNATQGPFNETNHSESSPTLGMVLALSIGVPLVLIACIVIIYCLWRSRRGGKKDADAEDILRKVVYIMSTADHPASVRVLDIFCDLLQKYCQCDVINPRDADLTQTCEKAWVTTNMSKSDRFVFVNFKGVDALLDAFLERHTTPPDPNHSLLLSALQIAFNINRHNLISITFTQDYASDKLAALNPKKFVLPKDLISLFAGIHDIGETSAKKYMSKVLHVDRADKLPEYQSLKKAVQELSEFENNNKQWFDDNYNVIRTTSSKPPASISSSVSSGHSSTIHEALSVSLTDISPDADSPVSVFGQPSFSQTPRSPDDGIGLEESNIFSIATIPGLYNRLIDGQSMVTFDQESDMQYAHTQTSGQSEAPCPQAIPPRTLSDIECGDVSTALRDTNEDGGTSKPTVSDKSQGGNPNSTQTIIPPDPNIALSSEDSLSTRIDNHNDNCSTWSKPLDLNTSCHIEDEKNGVHQHSIVCKPPRLSIPMDNISAMLEAFNDQDSAICLRNSDASAHEKEEFYDSGLPGMSV